MSIEEELGRQLQAKAAAMRTAPDLPDLSRRIRARQRRSSRHERLTLGAAIIVLAASLGGLAGALASTPQSRPGNSLYTRDLPGSSPRPAPTPRAHSTRPKPTASDTPVTVVNQELAGGLTVSASVQPLAVAVAITSEWSSTTSCATGETVTTTVGQSGSFGGGTSVARLPRLTASGLEVLASGVLQPAGGGQDWWVTVAVGSGVSTVAAENVGGAAVTVHPASGIAVIAGPMSGPNAGDGEMSAVAEGASGDESLGFLLGSGPKSVGASATTSDASACSVERLPAEPSSASSSQPAEPALATGDIIAAFEQADSANPLLGFAANLAAVNDGGQLSEAVSPSKQASRPADTVTSSNPSAGAVEVHQVSFLSASTAEVVYSLNGGVLLTGQAQLGASGIWRMSLRTFCANLRSGVVGGDVPNGVLAACQAPA